MRERTAEAPTWLHMGAGNIFRILVAGYQQDLLESGDSDKGIIVCECYDEEIIPAAFIPYDNLTLAVTLNADGSTQKRVIASVAEAFSNNKERLRQIITNPSLQIISFTITEKGYVVDPLTICSGPDKAITTLEQVAAGLFDRQKEAIRLKQSDQLPLALVTMDNFAENGTKLAEAIEHIATAWSSAGYVPKDFVDYVKTMAYPWTMIDKITPRPSDEVAKILTTDGYEDTQITETTKHTFIASFVNAESSQYLVIEDVLPGGSPPLQKVGVYITDRETVRKVDQMKVCACLNPLHTILAISGKLLNYSTISECMQDENLVQLIRKAANEALPMVDHPGIIDPSAFLQEVLTERFPNPFIPDAPARIACDTSQKIPVRFGTTLKAKQVAGMPLDDLEAIPLTIALWLRYRMGIDDLGNPMEISPDPRCPKSVIQLNGLPFGTDIDLTPILSDTTLFGVDLNKVGLSEKIKAAFKRLSAGPGCVAQELNKN